MTQPNTTPIKDIVVDASIEFMENNVGQVLTPKTDKMMNAWAEHISDSIQTYIDNKILEARIGWQLELPDLPHFQIQMFGTTADRQWISPIYNTKNLPAQLNRISKLKKGSE